MLSPYDRERKLMPLLVQATRRGVRVDRDELVRLQGIYTEAVQTVEERVRSTLGTPSLNIASGRDLSKALDAAGAVTHSVYTEKGNRSTARAVIEATVADKDLLNSIVYFNTTTKCLSDFINKWIIFSKDDGRLHPSWNQVRSMSDVVNGVKSQSKGARTGRMSCDHPNLQNVPNEYDLVTPAGLPDPPLLRKVFLPEEGHVWCKRDFSGQEIRIAAHFEDGVLLEAYVSNPALDPHGMAKEMIAAITGMVFERKHVKITGFQIIYGGGPRAVSVNVGCSYQEAAALIAAYLKAFPGIKKLQKETSGRGKSGDYITTWGGRKYYVEPSKMIDGKKRYFEYKLLNYLIQGSAADQTKQCILDWEDMRRLSDKFLATVHDEINISVPEDDWEAGMQRLKDAMDQDLFDVPMRSEGFVGPNWYDLKEAE